MFLFLLLRNGSYSNAYAQEIPQPHTSDQPKSHRTITATRHQKDKQSKATSSPLSIKVIAKLVNTQNTTQKH